MAKVFYDCIKLLARPWIPRSIILSRPNVLSNEFTASYCISTSTNGVMLKLKGYFTTLNLKTQSSDIYIPNHLENEKLCSNIPKMDFGISERTSLLQPKRAFWNSEIHFCNIRTSLLINQIQAPKDLWRKYFRIFRQYFSEFTNALFSVIIFFNQN